MVFNRQLSSAVGKHLRPYGFTKVGSDFYRSVNDVGQYCAVVRPHGIESGHFGFNVQLMVVSPSFQMRVHGNVAPGWSRAQILRSLYDLLGKGRYDCWDLTNEGEFPDALSEVLRGLDQVGLPFLDSLDTTEAVVANCLRPENQVKWRPLAEWEVAVYRGEATLADKPVRDFTEERAYAARIQEEIIREFAEDAARRREAGFNN